MIELKDVCFDYGEKNIFSALSFHFKSPGQYAVLGPSGCGKTTLLRLIAGLESPSSGQILRPELPISFCFQEDRLLPWATVQQNIMLAFPPELRRDRPRAAQQADLWLRRVGLCEEGNAYPGSLSGGMKRRAALARALAYDAPILLLDEPFRALDEAMHAQMLRLVRSASQNRLLLLVTHDEQDAQGMEILRLTPAGKALPHL